MFRAILLIILCGMGLNAFSQTCQIVSANSVCKEELISFDVTSSATIASVVWDMGDASTSTQINFNHKYSTAGVKNVKVTVTLSGGGTCVADKQITVYEVPEFKLKFKSNNTYCLSNNNVCIEDSSNGGEPGLTIKKRIVIWDDGGQSVTNDPPMGGVICHNYGYAGKFKITIELTNDKGCKSTKQLEVTILLDQIPRIRNVAFSNPIGYCDSALVLFRDSTLFDTSQVVNKIYNWGDGNTDTGRFTHLRHFYYSEGWYKLSLTYLQNNGCNTTKDTLVYVLVASVKPNILKSSDTLCFEGIVRVQQIDKLQDAYYYWHIGDSTTGIDEDGKDIFVYPNKLGRTMIDLQIIYQGCSKLFKDADSVEVIGIEPKIKILNDNQCDNMDTVYFCVDGERYGMGKLSYLWDFNDSLAPQCTSSVAKGINTKSNCNYSTDSFSKHKYVWGINRRWNLEIIDSVHGCHITTLPGYLNLVKPKAHNFRYKSQRKCLGTNSDYSIDFEHDFSPVVRVQVNIDSARDRSFFSQKFVYSFIYNSVIDPKGWVTVGFAVTYGKPKIYSGFDTTVFTIDSSRMCFDTIWFHNWFRLLPSPPAAFVMPSACIPATLKPKVFSTVLQDIAFTYWNWGDGSKNDTFLMNPGDSVLTVPSHTYKKAGHYFPVHWVENVNGCYGRYTGEYKIGFFPHILDFDSIICTGVSIPFNDSIFYDLDTPDVNNWHIPQRRKMGAELLRWDFDDGRGFATDTLFPVYKFQNQGFFTIRMAAKDKNNCWDTLSKTISVGGAHAGIKAVTKRIICDDIMQLFDSSFTDYPPPADSIIFHYWNFGDLGNPSILKDPFHFYKTFGEYRIFHRVQNTQGCVDTTSILIKIEGPIAKFDITSDTIGCAPFTARFKNQSVKTRDYIWYFGDPLNSKLSTNRDTSVSFTYTKPGTYYVYLFGSDSVINPNAGNAIYYCKSFFPDTTVPNRLYRKIIVLPSPKADFSVSTIQCKNKPIVVTDNSDTIYKRFKWVIPGIDSLETTNKTGILYSGDTGSFTIHFYPWYPPKPPYNLNCGDTVNKRIKVTEIVADFDIIKDTTSCPVFIFKNTTKGSKSILWNLDDSAAAGDKNIRFDDSFSYKYASGKGIFMPCLFVENFDGCRDTICKQVDVDFVVKLFIPNVFTPNNDGDNDVFDIDAQGLDEYDLSIYNRWGELVYQSRIDGIGNDGFNWTGRNRGLGYYPEGTYFYIFKFKYGCDPKQHKTTGTVTLIDARE